MKTKVYLVFNDFEATRFTKNKPSLKGGEVAVEINITIPIAWFRSAAPVVNVTLNEPSIPAIEVHYDPDKIYIPEVIETETETETGTEK